MTEKIALTADLAGLRQKVNFVRNGLGAAKTDLQTQLIRLDLNGGKLTLFAANKEMICRCELKVTKELGSKDGSFSVMGHKLAALTSTAEAEQITLEADQENLKATAGFLTVNLTLYDGAALRQIEQGCTDHLQTEGQAVDRALLEEALTCGRACSTTNAIRPDVNHVELRQGKVFASDGRKIMIYDPNHEHDKNPKKPPNLVKEANLKIPTGALGPVISALKNIEAEKIQLLEGPGYYFIKANLNAESIGVRKTERIFPDVEGMLDRAEKASDDVSVDRNVLTAALAGVALGLETEEVKVQMDVEGTPGGTAATLEVSAKNNLGRRSFERITGCGWTTKKGNSSPLSFPISYKHMLDTLSVFKGDTVVDMAINTSLSMLTVKDHTELREVRTLIPFRTDAQVDQEKKEAAAEEAAKKAQAKTDSIEDAKRELEGAVVEGAEAGDLELV